MIKINLLPVEKRKPERTPLPRFGLILANVAAGGVLVAVLVLELIRWTVVVNERDTKQKELAALSGHDLRIWMAHFSPDGNGLATAAEDQTIKLWDVAPRPAPAAPNASARNAAANGTGSPDNGRPN